MRELLPREIEQELQRLLISGKPFRLQLDGADGEIRAAEVTYFWRRKKERPS